MSQNTWPEFLSVVTLVVRSGLPESSLLPLVTDVIRSRDRDLPIRRLARIDDALQGSLAKRTFVSTLIVLFAAMTAVVVVLGVYGQFAQASARRLRELAVRRVLGATRSRVLTDVARGAVLLCLAGTVMGGLLALAITRLGKAFLIDAVPSDFGVSALGALLVLAAALTAASIPVAAAARKPIAAVLRARPRSRSPPSPARDPAAMDVARPDLSRARSRRRAWVIGVALGVLVIGGLALQSLAPASPSIPRQTVVIATVKAGTFERRVRAPGSLVPDAQRWLTATSIGEVASIERRAATSSRRTPSSWRSRIPTSSRSCPRRVWRCRWRKPSMRRASWAWKASCSSSAPASPTRGRRIRARCCRSRPRPKPHVPAPCPNSS